VQPEEALGPSLAWMARLSSHAASLHASMHATVLVMPHHIGSRQGRRRPLAFQNPFHVVTLGHLMVFLLLPVHACRLGRASGSGTDTCRELAKIVY
jgi:hypothetical protein